MASLIRDGIAHRSHLLHPVGGLAVQPFCDGDMCHRGCRSRAVPVLLAGREPDHISRLDDFDRTSLPLHPAGAERDDQDLTEGVGMPRSARARLEGDTARVHAERVDCLEMRSDWHRTGEVFGLSLREGCEPPRLMSIVELLVGSCAWPRAYTVASTTVRPPDPAGASRRVSIPRLNSRPLARLSLNRNLSDASRVTSPYNRHGAISGVDECRREAWTICARSSPSHVSAVSPGQQPRLAFHNQR